ncbi:hypothetical protein HYS31_04805 [Candidatus Woesearchaeota archaeon]|nr:hypothetical protein [Candidatus Woesearchaeota archaeon]
MCENPDIPSKTAAQRLEHKLLAEYQNREGRLQVDEKNAYFKEIVIPKDLWRTQALEMGLPADLYLDVTALAKNESGSHAVKFNGRTYLVEVNGITQSGYGLHREIKSVTAYQG